ncbi:hypothetical protein H8959_005540 [Pygathrix nigripes]
MGLQQFSISVQTGKGQPLLQPVQIIPTGQSKTCFTILHHASSSRERLRQRSPSLTLQVPSSPCSLIWCPHFWMRKKKNLSWQNEEISQNPFSAGTGAVWLTYCLQTQKKSGLARIGTSYEGLGESP